jgi:hypothetical protein
MEASFIDYEDEVDNAGHGRLFYTLFLLTEFQIKTL